jgi:hypothetical protein
LFKVAELSANTSSQWHFSAEFTSKCFEEIEKLMTLPEEEKKEEVKES